MSGFPKTHMLPPRLDDKYLISIYKHSKGARGLSV